jgi:hypothetical protein
MTDKKSLLGMAAKPFLILGAPPFPMTDRRSYVATLSVQGSPKLTACDVFSSLEDARLMAAAPLLLEALCEARDALIAASDEIERPGLACQTVRDKVDEIGTLLATIPVQEVIMPHWPFERGEVIREGKSPDTTSIWPKEKP